MNGRLAHFKGTGPKSYIYIYIYPKAHAPLPPALYKRLLVASRGLHDWLLELSGVDFGGSRGRLGASWRLLGDLGVVLGSPGAVLGHRWGRLEAFLGLLRTILESSWALRAAS